MIDEKLARETTGLLGTAAAMLIEDAHLELATIPTDIDAARDIATTLQRIGTDVNALGAAAVVLAQRSK